MWQIELLHVFTHDFGNADPQYANTQASIMSVYCLFLMMPCNCNGLREINLFVFVFVTGPRVEDITIPY